MNYKSNKKGNSGRVPDSKMPTYEKYTRCNITLSPEIVSRLEKYCDEEERAKSWVIQKALDKWLSSKGY